MLSIYWLQAIWIPWSLTFSLNFWPVCLIVYKTFPLPCPIHVSEYMALKLNTEFLSQPALLKHFLSQKMETLFHQFWLIDKNSGNYSQLLSFSPVPHQQIPLSQSSNKYEMDTSHYLHFYHLSKSYYFVSCLDYCNSILVPFPDSTLAPR